MQTDNRFHITALLGLAAGGADVVFRRNREHRGRGRGPYTPHQGKREVARRLAKPLHQPRGNGDQYDSPRVPRARTVVTGLLLKGRAPGKRMSRS